MHQVVNTQLFERTDLLYGMVAGSQFQAKYDQMVRSVSQPPSESASAFAAFMAAMVSAATVLPSHLATRSDAERCCRQPEEKREVQQAFERADGDSNGALTMRELQAAIDAAPEGSEDRGVLVSAPRLFAISGCGVGCWGWGWTGAGARAERN